MSSVIVRDFNPKLDSGFIYSTWPKSVFYRGVHVEYDVDRRAWFEDFHAYMKLHMPDAHIYVACMHDDPHTILGYSVVYGRALQFIYVKELFRQQGIAMLMLKRNNFKANIPVNPLFITRIGLAIMNDHPQLFTERIEESIQKEKEEYDPSHNSKTH